MLGIILIITGMMGVVVVFTVQFAPKYTGPVARPFQTAPTFIPRPYTSPSSAPKNIDEAAELAKSYITSLGYPDLALKEIMEFQYNYYFIAYEKSTGTGAFEGIIEKEIGLRGMGGMMGLIHPEQGPNMMWNTKYGHMGSSEMDGMMGGRQRGYSPRTGVPTSEMPVTAKDAKQTAQTYLSRYLSGSSLEDPDAFYGYYTVHILKDGKVYGMLSVNGYSGQVWYHTWHGTFIQMKEFD